MPIITLGTTGENRHSLMIEATQTEGGEMAAIIDNNQVSPNIGTLIIEH